jgi:hypothetical protein
MTARTIDETFLRAHPRTALWQRQRAQCAGCAHLIDAPLPLQHQAMRCAAVPVPQRQGRPRAHDPEFCIDAREEGAACGPDAVLFTPAPR